MSHADERVIRTARLCLRPWREEDLDAFAEMNADPVVMEFFPRPWSREESEASFSRIQKHWNDYGFGIWVVEVQGEFAGTLGLQQLHFESNFTPNVEIGYRAIPRWWNQGLMTEAGRAALRYGFDLVGLPEIVAFTRPDHVRSRRVMEKLGMRYAGEFEHPGGPHGNPLGTHVLYQVGRAKWAEDQLRSE